MKRYWVVVSIIVLVTLVVSGAVWFVDTQRLLILNFGPIPKGAPTLTRSDIENLLAEDYRVVRHIRQIPSALKESFTNVTGLPFDMNNPGDPMSTDLIINAPSRQLIFAAAGKQSAVVVYEQGTFASFPCAVVLSKTGAAAWIAIADYRPTVISDLRRSVHEVKFKPMQPSN